MSLLQGGVPEAFDVLQKRHHRRVYLYLLKFTRDVHVAEDLLQETFLRVYRSRHTYRRIAKLTTWLFTIAGNLARSEYRKKQRTRSFAMPSTRLPDGSAIEIPDARFVPDENIQIRMETERVLRAIDRLPGQFREVVMLRGLQDMSYDEIHRVTGVPIGTVKSRIHRGRSLLSKMLNE